MAEFSEENARRISFHSEKSFPFFFLTVGNRFSSIVMIYKAGKTI